MFVVNSGTDIPKAINIPVPVSDNFHRLDIYSRAALKVLEIKYASRSHWLSMFIHRARKLIL